MKSRSQELLDKAVAAMLSAIEIYNKPDFKYREETFAILAINAWELVLKAKWLKDHRNQIRSLYVTERRNRSNGQPYKHAKIKTTVSGNPYTHGIDYVAKKLVEQGILPIQAHKNIVILCEIRDSAVHFYNHSSAFAVRLQEVGSAAVKNFARAVSDWFSYDLGRYNFYLMPLAFVRLSEKASGLLMNKEEKNVATFITNMQAANDEKGDYSVAVTIEMRVSRSKAEDAIRCRLTNDPAAIPMRLSEEQLSERYPYTYRTLTDACRKRYLDFVENSKYHDIRIPLKEDRKYCYVRLLNPENPDSSRTERFSEAVFNVFDQHYVLN